jgi:hypothetical protein
MGTTVTRRLHSALRVLRNLGPYLLIEILLPGGTLIALLLYASRSGRLFRDDAPALATVLTLASALAHPMARTLSSGVFQLPGGNPAQRDGLEPLAMAPG